MVIRADLALDRMTGFRLPEPLNFRFPSPDQGAGLPAPCGCQAPSQSADSFGSGSNSSEFGQDPWVMLAQLADLATKLMQLAQMAQTNPAGLINMLSSMAQQPGRDLGSLGGLGNNPLSSVGRNGFSQPSGTMGNPELSGPGRLPGTTGDASLPAGTNTQGVQRYAPGSAEARALFREAARNAGLPESWADSPGLHNILRRESDGQVGRPNYTYGSRARDPSQWGSIHDELKAGRRTTRSSATGLGQLLLANVDRYYPSGRAGIGDPLEEATGMLRYIADRYGSPDRAWAQYGRRHEGY